MYEQPKSVRPSAVSTTKHVARGSWAVPSTLRVFSARHAKGSSAVSKGSRRRVGEAGGPAPAAAGAGVLLPAAGGAAKVICGGGAVPLCAPGLVEPL